MRKAGGYIMEISKDIKYVGVNDHQVDLFEGQYIVPNGMAYNSYVILDEKIAVMDSVDVNFSDEWLSRIKSLLGDKVPGYIIVQHMEPDHSGSLEAFLDSYKDTVVVASAAAFNMMKNYFGKDYSDRRITITDGASLELGKHTLSFVTAPMVHWPEVIMTYDTYDKVLFSADAFGKFGALDTEEDWACEARRYYFGIVGKFGVQVQALLTKVSAFDIQTICPLHGPVLNENLGYYLNLYNTWSSYGVETEGVAIAYTSVYGNTRKAAELLKEQLLEKGCPKVAIFDLAREDMAECVEDAFRYGKLVLATTTYNADIFPFMRSFIYHLTERGVKNKKIGFIENGSWAPMATKVMQGLLEECKDLTYLNSTVKIMGAVKEDNVDQIKAMAEELMA